MQYGIVIKPVIVLFAIKHARLELNTNIIYWDWAKICV